MSAVGYGEVLVRTEALVMKRCKHDWLRSH